jgi:hypothetical protein
MRYQLDYSVYIDAENDGDAADKMQEIYDDVLLPAFRGTGWMLFPVGGLRHRSDLDFLSLPGGVDE